MVFKGKPRKKYWNPNRFLKTSVGYVFHLNLTYRGESIDRAVQERITGHKGYFVLTCSKVVLPGNMLRTYRLESRIEDAFKDMKHRINIRPLRCRNENSLR